MLANHMTGGVSHMAGDIFSSAVGVLVEALCHRDFSGLSLAQRALQCSLLSPTESDAKRKYVW